MNNWFTVEQIDRDTFAVGEYKHWEETHCYLICGEKSAALIDTGLSVSNIREVVDVLTKPVTVFTTYAHWGPIDGHGFSIALPFTKRRRTGCRPSFPYLRKS